MPARQERTRHDGKYLLLLVFLYLLGSHSVSAQTARGAALDLDGHSVDPFRLAGSKLVAFVFIRTDCPISNRYAPTIRDLSSRYGEHAVFFLVYPIASETPEQIRKHLREYGYHLPALRDPDLVLARESHVSITPEAAVFSPDKKLLYHGRIDDWYVDFGSARREPTTHELASTLDNALAHKPVVTTDAPAVGCFIPGLT
jgi:thiol-disulfide isomerase/thioredoxin